jgi:NADH dehydrogenase
VLGTVTHVDARQKVVTWSSPEGGSGQAGFDRLILTAGSVNKLLPIPGVADYAHGFRSIAEAILPARPHHPSARAGRRAADEAGTPSALHLRRCRRRLHRYRGRGPRSAAHDQAGQGGCPGLAGEQIRWLLLDTAPRLLP